jgi:hypothetical protein
MARRAAPGVLFSKEAVQPFEVDDRVPRIDYLCHLGAREGEGVESLQSSTQ